MDEETAITVVNLKRQLKDAPLSVILKQARQREILPVDFKVSPATLYRLFNQHGLMDEEVLNEDLRRYETELANDIWQSDCMHGLMVDVDKKMKKTYLFGFIDDMSRLISHAKFYLYDFKKEVPFSNHHFVLFEEGKTSIFAIHQGADGFPERLTSLPEVH